MTDTNKEREAFEKWARDDFYSGFADIAGDRVGTSYRDMAHHMAWYAYQAGRASLAASAPAPSEHIKEPYTLAEIKAKIASNDYSAELMLQHAMLHLDRLAASAGSEPVAWRYVDARGHFRYVGYKPSRDMAAEYPMLKPIRLYTHPSPPEGAGTVSVPKEPTAEMKLAAQKADMDHSDHEEWLRENWPDFKRVWDAMITAAIRLSGWSLLLAGLGAGIVLPHPVTTALWIAAARQFAQAGDRRMVARLTSAAKFGPRVRRGLERPLARRAGGVAEAF